MLPEGLAIELRHIIYHRPFSFATATALLPSKERKLQNRQSPKQNGGRKGNRHRSYSGAARADRISNGLLSIDSAGILTPLTAFRAFGEISFSYNDRQELDSRHFALSGHHANRRLIPSSIESSCVELRDFRDERI